MIDETHIQEYQIFQLLHLLSDESVRFHTFAHFGFPASDIAQISKTENQKIVEINVLGLLGIDSPLPHYMSLITTQEENQAWHDFLNVFNHIFYKLLYQLWLKYHPLFSIGKKDSWYINCLRSLSNLASKELYLTDIFYHKTKNAKHLAQMIYQVLDETNIEIKESIPSWQPLPNPSRLNHECYLGDNTALGNNLLDAISTIGIHIKLSNVTKARQLLRGKLLYPKLISLIRRFFGPGFFYRISITVDMNQIKIPVLNQEPIPLDGFTQIGSSSEFNFRLPHKYIYSSEFNFRVGVEGASNRSLYNINEDCEPSMTTPHKIEI